MALELPSALGSARPDLSRVRLTLELPFLLTLWGLTEAASAARRDELPTRSQRISSRLARRAIQLAALFLVALRLDAVIGELIMREELLLYDQWFMLRHLGVLLSDLMSWTTFAALALVVLGGWLLTRGVRALLARAEALFAPERRAATSKAALVIWSMLLGASAAEAARPDPLVGFMTPRFLDNVARSHAVYGSVHQRLARSPYAHYDELTLRDRPDVLLFIVESYGRLLWVEPAMRDAHARLLAELARALEANGWRSASAFSTAPVSGARSWIAEGTMLMGTSIRYESVFQHLVAERPTSLVSFLNGQGYETMLLAPADRDRPGTKLVNRYGFSRVVAYSQLGYRGPAVGWGIVPDQYSLEYAAQHLLGPRARPVFLDFHMVSSHAPWHDVPRLEEHVQLARGASVPREERAATPGMVLDRLTHYQRAGDGRFAYMDALDERMREGYQATIDYDLQLIARYLGTRTRDALVVLIGDHQPPVISRADASFDSPVHVLSRSPERLREFERHGFVPASHCVRPLHQRSRTPACSRCWCARSRPRAVTAAGCRQ